MVSEIVCNIGERSCHKQQKRRPLFAGIRASTRWRDGHQGSLCGVSRTSIRDQMPSFSLDNEQVCFYNITTNLSFLTEYRWPAISSGQDSLFYRRRESQDLISKGTMSFGVGNHEGRATDSQGAASAATKSDRSFSHGCARIFTDVFKDLV